MSTFQVGTVYHGWCNRGDGHPALVVAMAPDRSYLMMTFPQGSNPLAARRHEIINDPRFGEKVVEKCGAARYVWRADKAWKTMDIPANWLDADAKDRSEAAKEAAKTRAQKKSVKEIAAKITPRIMAKICALRAKACGAGEEWNEEKFLAYLGNVPKVEIGAPQKGKKSGMIWVSCRVYGVMENGEIHSQYATIYADKIVAGCGSEFEITGDEFTNLFKAQ